MNDDKSPVEQALDLFVYAPLGLALDARVLMPKLIERGRNQVTMARMIGQFAVTHGQTEAGKQLAKLEEQVTDALVGLGLVPAPDRHSARRRTATSPSSSRSTTATPTTTSPARATGPGTPTPAETTATPPPDPAPAGPPADDEAEQFGRKGRPRLSAVPDRSPSVSAPGSARPPAADLAIPDYDSLAASQVIPRLAGLSGEELAAVRSYETIKRGRKTILNRIAQLQSA